MKRYFTLLVLLLSAISLNAQTTDNDILNKLNNKQKVTATLTSASRLFSDKDDLASVQSIVPSGSTVQILGLDDTYYRVMIDDTEGYIFKRHATIDEVAATNSSVDVNTYTATQQQQATTTAANSSTQSTRMVSLLAKYDFKTAKAIYERKIWKGMDTDMVLDSWGNPKNISRNIVSDDITEQWSYTTSNLYFHNDILVSWGPKK